MKKILLILSIVFSTINFVNGQAAWIEPDPTIVTSTVRLYVDLDK